MAINAQRGDKADKDAAAVLGIWQHLDQGKLADALAALTKKERARATEFMRDHGLDGR